MPLSKPLRNLGANAYGSDNVYRMTRPLRLEFPGALYHVTSRGDRRGTIYRDDTDRLVWQEVLALVCERYHFVVHSFCQMSNHYHLLVETVEANLSQGMRQLNGVYTQHFNRRHKLVGHVLQGRYKAILMQQENYLLELARYIVLNPVRAHMVGSPDDRYWSSHHYVLYEAASPCWLSRDWLLSQFGATRDEAAANYSRFVAARMDETSPLAHTCHQMLLGNETFVSAHQQSQRSDAFKDTPRQQRRAVASAISGQLQRQRRGDGTRLSVNRFYHVPHRLRFSRVKQDGQSGRIGIY
ncbi:transposase [Janthinobacterium sp. BJB304]|uniref:transposase n=1 Tax=Janthinobacterium sp. BJB304 TaxID=1572871 RepID=UPI00211DDD87|nr:transposase [Janthinobacterium sp. BJB304]